ncbi:hypothetical protein [Anabaena azotica]|uniref:Uncharacterized protein n=1 Tax=Anabaena azotica FACHB-119 TaxID=947527 RepID=A0ABR8DAK7_9NOST|nr:hypothetical protein [Anabaena azotica]MBD2503971.1 hypothetical protein [Anabaena azotica FACHB-119]
MLVIGDIIPLPLGNKSKKYGEFGLPIYLSNQEIKKLKSIIIEFQTDIELAFNYFTTTHLEEAINNNGVCYLTACYEKDKGHLRNDGELEDDAVCLKEILKS